VFLRARGRPPNARAARAFRCRFYWAKTCP
jgi:hypothetical protein